MILNLCHFIRFPPPALSSLLLLFPVGIRVLHPLLGESGIPAQHCQKVHRPEVCPTGESVSHQRVASIFHLPSLCLVLIFLSPLLCAFSSWSCLTARIPGRETTWRQSCIESMANSWGWGLLYENRSIIFFYGELTFKCLIQTLRAIYLFLQGHDCTIFKLGLASVSNYSD